MRRDLNTQTDKSLATA